MLTIGLTGGIGSGKTTVSNRFAALGVPVIDTDLIAHALTRPGQPALAEIYRHFGKQVFLSEQQLDRAALRKLILTIPASRQQLESILHPLIKVVVSQRRIAIHAPLCVLVVPLLVEAGWQSRVNRVLVIDARESARRRWIRRRQLSHSEIDALLAAQTDRQNRLDHADDIILNDQDLPQLYRQVDRLYRHYLQTIHLG